LSFILYKDPTESYISVSAPLADLVATFGGRGGSCRWLVSKAGGATLKPALLKIWQFWTVSNRPKITKNRLEKGPDGFFWTVSNRP